MGRPIEVVLLYDALGVFDGALELIRGVSGSPGEINSGTFNRALDAIGSGDAPKPSGAGALGSPAVNV
jgi:hypothetical protein